MPIAIERYWPSKASPGKLDSWVNHQKEIVVDEAELADICGVTFQEVTEYLNELEAKTSYRMDREWITRKNMVRKERVVRDKEILLLAMAIGNVEIKTGKENELIIESRKGEMQIITKIAITPEQLLSIAETWWQL